MIYNVLSIILYVISGFFIFTINLCSFLKVPSPDPKIDIIFCMTVPVILALCGGLAINRFRNWKKVTGIVLLSTSAYSALVVLAFFCLLLSEETRKMFNPAHIIILSDYYTGFTVMLGFFISGLLLYKSNENNAEPIASADAEIQRS